MCPNELLSFPSFFFNDTATTEIYTLSLHDALPISQHRAEPQGEGRPEPAAQVSPRRGHRDDAPLLERAARGDRGRSEEHTSELQSRLHLVCRLLLEKKKVYRSLEHDQKTRITTLVQ